MTLRRHRARSLSGIVAVVQVMLLLGSVLVIPAPVIAQDPPATTDVAVEASPVPAEQVPEEEPAGSGGGDRGQNDGRDVENGKADDVKADKDAPAHEGQSETAGSALEAGNELSWVLRIHPRVVKLEAGTSSRVQAFRCEERAGGFGKDRKPATEDDTCSPVKASWSEKPRFDLLALSREEGRRVRVTAGSSAGDSILVAVRGGEKAEAAVRVEEAGLSTRDAVPVDADEPTTVEAAASSMPNGDTDQSAVPSTDRDPDEGAGTEQPERAGSDRPDEPEPEATQEARQTDEPGPDLTADPDPTVETESGPATDPGPTVEPKASTAEPESSTGPEPIAEPDRSAGAASRSEPEPSIEADHPVEPEPSASAAPCDRPEPAPSVTPGTEDDPVSEASPVVVTCIAADESASPSPSTEALPEPSHSSVPESSRSPLTDPPSSAELNRVTVVAAADIDGNGLFDDLVTIESPAGTILQNVSAIRVPTDPPPPAGVSFPAGLFEYEVVVAEPGDPAAVTFRLPDGAVSEGSETEFWVLQNGRWSDLTERSDADHVADEVTVTLVDGGPGDEDLTADGVIDDPGGPGEPFDDWSLTITVDAPSDPTADFTFFVEECAEVDGALPCTPQPTRLWVDSDVEPTSPTVVDPTPVVLSHGESFTWDGLETDRHYRVIDVDAAAPPATGTGSLPAGWAVTGFECDSVGATILDTSANSVTGRLTSTIAEGLTSPGWAACVVDHDRLIDQRSGSTIIANKWGDRSPGGINQGLAGATMGIWRDNGNGEFEPGVPPPAGDGDPIGTCVTAASGSCQFAGLASGGYWVQEISSSNVAFAPITTWAPGAYNIANPPLPYAAYRYGDPAADGHGESNGYPITVNGSASDVESTDFFANRRVNPSISDFECDALMRIVIILDRSGSIQENGPAGYEDAITSFVMDLAGTNTEMGIVSFAANAQIEEDYLDIDDDQAQILDAIADVYDNLGGGTNWDAGLRLVDTFTPNPDLVLMVTDGNPTLNQATTTSSGEVNWFDFTQAVTSSNRLKVGGGASPPSRVIAVAAGSAGSISVEGLIGISGPLTDQPNALDSDYFLGTVDELAEELRRLALARCGSSVRVKKEIETSPGAWGPGEGWTFDIDVSGIPGVTPVPPTQTVLDGGVAEIVFEWAGPGQRTVTVTEENVDPALDYFDPQMVCWPGPDYEGEGAPLTPTSLTARFVTFTIPSDSDYSCRFRNSPRPIELIVEKVIVNDDGGSAVVGDFNILTDAGALTFGPAVEGPTDTFTYTAESLEVLPGSYDLAEDDLDGYTEGDWECDNGDGGPFDDGEVTLELGDDPVTCSITNDDDPVELIIVKTVINDDGGTATVDDFGITTDAGALTFTSDGGSPITVYTADTLEVAAGTYTLSEMEVDGYVPSDWTCDNGDGGPFDDGSVALEFGDDPVTCSITNDDVPPASLTVVKTVSNDDGGTATVDDFDITTDAGTLTFTSDGGSPTTVYTSDTIEVDAGTYSISETDVAGYAEGTWTCDNGDTGPFDGVDVTLEVGDDVTCSITNDDEPIELIFEKVILNDDGGTATVGDFGITTTAGALTFGPAVEDPVDTFTYTAETLLVAAGTYELAELVIPGYAPTDWTCTNGDGGAFDAGTVTLATGDEPVTCSITNNDFTIEVLKVAGDQLIPPEGQDVTFTFTVTNPSDIPVEIVSLDDDVFGTLSGDADCQAGTVLPPGGSCEFEETFFVKSDVVPNGNPDQVFPPHVNTFSACAAAPAVVPASALAPAAVAGPGEACDDDPETIRFTGGAIAGCCQPPTDTIVAMSDASSPPIDARLAWLALMVMAATAIVATGATIGRLRREERTRRGP
jgi:hypothetical protein